MAEETLGLDGDPVDHDRRSPGDTGGLHHVGVSVQESAVYEVGPVL